MAKTKKISVNAFEKAMKDTYIPSEVFEWNGIEVTVKKNLSLKEMMEFVDNTARSCFAADTNTYLPEVKDFIIKTCVLEKYANFTMPNNVELQYALVYQTDIAENVLLHINQAQYAEICAAIDKKIENIVQINVEDITKQINEIHSMFDNLGSQIENLFKGIDNNDMRAIAGALANGGLNEEKLIEAYTKLNGEKRGEP